MPTFRLVLQSEPGRGTEFPLDKAELFLGRDPGNDVVINDPEVSRRHARLLLVGNSYSIEDLGSTNGTFIRDQRLSAPVTLRPGDMITMGEKVIVKFEVTGAEVDATIAAFRTPTQQAPRPAVPNSQASVPPFKAEPVVPVNVPPVPSAQPYPQPQQAAPVQIPPTPQPTPVYAPVAPPPQVAPSIPPVRKKMSGWLVALLIVLALLVIFCVIPWIIIEITDSYCSLMPGIFNSIQPGACP